MVKFKTREQWLTAAGRRLEKLFKTKGYDVSPDYRVSCGFPKSTGMGYGAIGQCWSKTVSKGKVSEIFVSPIIEDPARAVDILAHEMVHHYVGIKAGHNKVFSDCAKKIGLEGKPTHTIAGPEFLQWWEKTKGWLGGYPHHAMQPHAPLIPGPAGVPVPDPTWETTPRRKSGSVVKFKCSCGMKFSTSHGQAELVTSCPACKKELS